MATVTTIQAPAVAFNSGSFTLSAQVSNANSALSVQSLTFGSATTIAFTTPTGTTSAYIIPPSANGVQLTLKGVSGDTGIPISPNQLTGPITFFSNSGTNTFNLTSAGAITGPVQIVTL